MVYGFGRAGDAASGFSRRSYFTPGGKSFWVRMTRSMMSPGQTAVPVTETAQPATRASTGNSAPTRSPTMPAAYSDHVGAQHGSRRRTVLEQSEQRVEVQMGGEQIGDLIQLTVPARADVDVVGDDEPVPSGGDRCLGQPLPAELVVVEQAVPVGAAHRATPQPDTVPVVGGGPGHLPVVDLVAAQGPLPAAQGLVGGELDVNVEQAETVDPADAGF